MQKKSYTLEVAKKKIEYYCAYQERCCQEVRHKLKQMGVIPEAIEQILDGLISENFLNEARFARAFVSGKFHIKKWGKLRLRRELKKRQIEKTYMDQALRDIDDIQYRDTLEALAQKRLSELNDQTAPLKKRKQLADYLLYRGWESDLVYDKVRELVPILI